MTMTSDECRDVAENLRYLNIGHHIQYKEQFFDELAEVVVGFEDYHDFNAVLEKLADLIDPTCHLVGTISVDGLDGQTIFSHELSCGHTLDTVWPNPPAFCDECGARVVEKEEDE